MQLYQHFFTEIIIFFFVCSMNTLPGNAIEPGQTAKRFTFWTEVFSRRKHVQVASSRLQPKPRRETRPNSEAIDGWRARNHIQFHLVFAFCASYPNSRDMDKVNQYYLQNHLVVGMLQPNSKPRSGTQRNGLRHIYLKLVNIWEAPLTLGFQTGGSVFSQQPTELKDF